MVQNLLQKPKKFKKRVSFLDLVPVLRVHKQPKNRHDEKISINYLLPDSEKFGLNLNFKTYESLN